MSKSILFAALLALSLPLAAHEHEPMAEAKAAANKAKASVQQAGAKVAEVGKDIAQGAQALGQEAKEAVAEAKAGVIQQVKPLEALKANADKHMHNKVVHFPIALGIFGVLFFLMSAKWAQYLWPSRLLLMAALAGGGLSLLTGEAQEGAFDGTNLVDTLHLHERMGQISLALFGLTLLLTFFPSARKWSWIVALAGAVAVMVAGGLGGVLATS